MSISTIIKLILFKIKFQQTKTEQPIKPGLRYKLAISLVIRVVTSIKFGSFRIAKLLQFVTLNLIKIRFLTQKKNLYINTICKSIKKTLIVLNLFQILINYKIQIQILKLGLLLLQVIKIAIKIIKLIKLIQKLNQITTTSLETIQYFNLQINKLT